MKLFKFRKMVSMIVSVCLLAEIFTWNAVFASAAELPDPAESTGGSISD